MYLFIYFFFFFFSSRRRHTRYWRDWSSDVCSSDLVFDHFCGFGHHYGIRAEELRRDGVLVFLEIEITQSFFGAACDAFGAGELGHQQAAATEAANHAAEERVRHARHRCEDRSGANGQVADLEARRNHWPIDDAARVRVHRDCPAQAHPQRTTGTEVNLSAPSKEGREL